MLLKQQQNQQCSYSKDLVRKWRLLQDYTKHFYRIIQLWHIRGLPSSSSYTSSSPPPPQPPSIVLDIQQLNTPFQSNYSSIRSMLPMRPQQDFHKFSCSCCCPLLLSCSFLVPLGHPSHYPSTSLVDFPCFLFPPLVCKALLLVVYFPPSSLHARTVIPL